MPGWLSAGVNASSKRIKGSADEKWWDINITLTLVGETWFDQSCSKLCFEGLRKISDPNVRLSCVELLFQRFKQYSSIIFEITIFHLSGKKISNNQIVEQYLSMSL